MTAAGGVDAELLKPPVNVLRLSLHPQGLAPRIANLPEWRAHLLARLRREIELTADPVLAELLQELSAYPVHKHTDIPDYNTPIIPFQLMTESGLLSFISTTTVFGTPVDITLSEITLESFFPADAKTAEALRAMLL